MPHLEKRRVGPGDLFLFFGLFREVEGAGTSISYTTRVSEAQPQPTHPPPPRLSSSLLLRSSCDTASQKRRSASQTYMCGHWNGQQVESDLKALDLKGLHPMASLTPLSLRRNASQAWQNFIPLSMSCCSAGRVVRNRCFASFVLFQNCSKTPSVSRQTASVNERKQMPRIDVNPWKTRDSVETM